VRITAVPGDLPRDHLVEEQDAEHRHQRPTYIGGDGAERHVGDEPYIGRYPKIEPNTTR
jgi:hypothetical protein